MGVTVGSARVDERGKYSGGKAGSQIDKEISKQDWYLHSKGWWVIRPKRPEVAEKIAKDMEYACESKYVGYDQGENKTLYNAVKPLNFDISKLKTMCETDCARLVRVCVKFAGVDAADFYTGDELEALKATGEFEILKDDKYCKSSDYLKRGDILVTRSKGHTVVVLNNGAKVVSTSATNVYSANIKKGQAWINDNYGSLIKKHCGALLEEDGSCGAKTRAAIVCVWKDVVNRKYGFNLTPSNPNFLDSCKTAAKKANIERGDSGTLVMLAQIMLAAEKLYAKDMDCKFGGGMEDAVEKFQSKNKLEVDGKVGSNTWYAIFN